LLLLCGMGWMWRGSKEGNEEGFGVECREERKQATDLSGVRIYILTILTFVNVDAFCPLRISLSVMSLFPRVYINCRDRFGVNTCAGTTR
jgi:hypothetical protein